MNFFIATIGRSGSTWLSTILNKSPTHTVEHEVADGRNPGWIHPYAPFPIERFSQPNYGEVHGFLRYNLSAGIIGVERLIPRRGLLVRDPKAVIHSWMNRDNRTIDEVGAVMFEALTQHRLLQEWAKSDRAVRVIKFEEITTDIKKLRDVYSWLEIDCMPTEEDMKTVINPNRKKNRWWEWDDKMKELYKKIGKRQGMRLR